MKKMYVKEFDYKRQAISYYNKAKNNDKIKFIENGKLCIVIHKKFFKKY